GVKCTTDGIYQGVSQVRWPGRFHLLQKNPWVLLDGVINKTSAKLFVDSIQFPAKRMIAVLAIHTAKDLAGVCFEIAKIADTIILTEVHTRPLEWDKEALLKSATKYCKDVLYIPTTKDAFTFV